MLAKAWSLRSNCTLHLEVAYSNPQVSLMRKPSMSLESGPWGGRGLFKMKKVVYHVNGNLSQHGYNIDQRLRLFYSLKKIRYLLSHRT